VLRVTFVLPGYAKRAIGGYKVIFQYANLLVERGHSVTIIQGTLFVGGRMPPGSLNPANLLRSMRANIRRHSRPTWFPLDERVQIHSALVLRRRFVPDADVVVATSCRTAPFVASLPPSCGGAGYFIQHFEDWDAPLEFVEYTWRLPLSRIVIAKWLREKATELSVDAEYVPNAIDPAEFPVGPPLPQRPRRVAAMVSDVPWKRTDLLIDVLRAVKAQCPDTEAVTFGACPRPIGLPDFVEHVMEPSRDELRHVYQSSRVYICCSDAEGWHLPPAEAMLSGCTVASTDIAGVTEYATDLAKFSPVGDAAALAANVITLLSDETAAAALAERGRASLVAYGPVEAVARLTEALTDISARATGVKPALP
jgi:glycosyltransferase involved in cell wall biosynthesis